MTPPPAPRPADSTASGPPPLPIADPAATPPVAADYPPYRAWLWLLAVGVVVCTFVLVTLGGHVTSSDAGMAVPEGFFTGPYWSLISPLEYWWHDMGRRLEHSHRLQGYVVGLLTIALTVSLLMTQGHRRWLKVLGVALLLFVIAQGALGIIRVSYNQNPWVSGSLFAAVHGVTGQLFLCLTVVVAAAVGRFWMTRKPEPETGRHGRSLRLLPLVLLLALTTQLAMGAAVRHTGSALAIPDWPMHYGRLVPPMTQENLDAAVAAYPAAALPERYGRATVVSDGRPYLVGQVHLHFAHRLGAYLITVFGLGYVAFLARRYAGRPDAGAVLRPAVLFGGLLIVQVGLGVMTVWSGEHATLATAHQTVGAGLFAAATWLTVRLHLVRGAWDRPENIPVAAGDATTESLRVAAAGGAL